MRTRSSGRKAKTEADPATAWAQAAVRGDFVVGDIVRHAAERHLRDLRDAEHRGYYWRPELAQKALDFFPSVFSITDGPAAGKPFHLLPYMTFCVGSLMGWVNAAGRWRFRSGFIETGKGQAKSPMMGGLGLYAMGWCGFPRSQVYSIAANKQTAFVLFKDAVAMCRAQVPGYDEHETLEDLGHVVIRGEGDNAHKIEHPKTQSFFLPLAGGEQQSGPRPRMVLADEIHEFTTDTQIETWRRAITKVAGSAMMLMGTNTPATSQIVGSSYSDTAIAVAKGELKDDTQFAFVARTDKEDRDTVFDNEACWPKSLPALGITYPVSNIREEVQTARTRISTASSVKRLYFGIPLGAADFWINEEDWAAVQGTVDELALRGCRCWISLDLSKKNDLTALTVTWLDERPDRPTAALHEGGGGHIWSKTWYWTSKTGLADRATADHAPYEDWVEEGHLEAVQGAKIDYTFIAAKLKQIVGQNAVEELVVDSALMADFEEACDAVEFPIWRWEGKDGPKGTGLKWVFHAQGKRVFLDKPQYCMPLSIRRLEDRILGRTITIDDSPVTYMCAANAAIDADGMENRCFDKKRSRGRIDGMVTIAMGVGAADDAEAPPTKSFWEE